MPLIASAPPHPFQVPPGAPRRKTASVVFRCRGVFRIDIERCPQCGGRVRVIACIDSPEVIDTILSHLAAREADTARGMHPARAPPRKGYPGPWQTHTKRMLRHKTLIQGFRLAFGFAGIYDEDEAGRIIDAQYAHVEQLPVDDPARRLARRLAAPKADSTSAPEPTVVAPLAVDEPQESDKPVTDSAAPTANEVAAMIERAANSDGLDVCRTLIGHLAPKERARLTKQIAARAAQLGEGTSGEERTAG